MAWGIESTYAAAADMWTIIKENNMNSAVELKKVTKVVIGGIWYLRMEVLVSKAVVYVPIRSLSFTVVSDSVKIWETSSPDDEAYWFILEMSESEFLNLLTSGCEEFPS